MFDLLNNDLYSVSPFCFCVCVCVCVFEWNPVLFPAWRTTRDAFTVKPLFALADSCIRDGQEWEWVGSLCDGVKECVCGGGERALLPHIRLWPPSGAAGCFGPHEAARRRDLIHQTLLSFSCLLVSFECVVFQCGLRPSLEPSRTHFIIKYKSFAIKCFHSKPLKLFDCFISRLYESLKWTDCRRAPFSF